MTPTCLYHEDRACAKPKLCPVHGPVLARPSKTLHFLREGLHPMRWDRNGEGRWLRTFCGLLMHRRLDDEEIIRNVMATGVKGAEALSAMFARRDELELAGWKQKPIASVDPSFEVFYEVGCDRREVLITTTHKASCKRCTSHEGSLQWAKPRHASDEAFRAT